MLDRNNRVEEVEIPQLIYVVRTSQKHGLDVRCTGLLNMLFAQG